MSVDTPVASVSAPSTGTGHAGFGRMLLAEWTKLRTVRSTGWSLAITVFCVLGFAALFTSIDISSWKNETPVQHQQFLNDPTATILGSGLGVAQLAICVLGVLVTASEYSTGMIRSTLLASPHRLRMLAAKSVVFAVVVLIIGEVVALPAFFIGKSIVASKAKISLGDPGVLRAVIGMGLYLAMLGLFSLAIGAIIRHTAGAITGTIAFVLVISQILQLIPGSIGDHLYSYSPNVAGSAIMTAHPYGHQLLTPWQGYAVFGGWTALLLIIAGWLLVKRDA